MRKRNARPRNEREKQARDRALHALNLVRRKGYALSDALDESETSARSFYKYVGSEVLPSKPGQRLRVTKEDRRIREMPMATALGDVPKKIHGSRNASLNASHRRAMLHYLRKGDDSLLKAFHGKSIEGVQLLTDPELIALRLWTSFIHPQDALIQKGALQGRNCSLGFRILPHLDECEATRLAGVTILYYCDGCNGPVAFE